MFLFFNVSLVKKKINLLLSNIKFFIVLYTYPKILQIFNILFIL